MKKNLQIKNTIILLAGAMVIAVVVIGFYFTNPYNVPSEQLEQIQQEEGLK